MYSGLSWIRVVNRIWAFRVGCGPGSSWMMKNCRALIGPDVGAKSRFSEGDRVFTIDRM